MTAQDSLTRFMNSLKTMLKNALRSFEREHDDYPETGTRPLKHDTYKEGKERHKH